MLRSVKLRGAGRVGIGFSTATGAVCGWGSGVDDGDLGVQMFRKMFVMLTETIVNIANQRRLMELWNGFDSSKYR